MALALFVVFLLGLATRAFLLSNKVKEESWRKEAEGHPTWEEVVNQIKKVEQSQSDANLVRIEVIGRWVHCFISFLPKQ